MSLEEKCTQIFLALDRGEAESLENLACSEDGLVSNELRAKAWPVLLGCPDIDYDKSWRDLPPHDDEDQIKLDVQRTRPFVGSTVEIKDFKASLEDLIVHLFRTNRELSYYQGFHNISALFITVFQFDSDKAFASLSRFVILHLRDFMMPTIEPSVSILKIVPEIIGSYQEDVYSDLMLGVLEPYYCLSPIVTLFTHEICNSNSLGLIFDRIIACGSISFVLYLYSSLVVGSFDELIGNIEVSDDDMFSKQDLIHNELSKFLHRVTYHDIKGAIHVSEKMMKTFPLKNMQRFKGLGRFSVLRTTPTSRKSVLNNVIDRELLLSQIKEAGRSPNTTHTGSIANWILSSNRSRQLLTLSLAVGVLGILTSSVLSYHDPGAAPLI